jgi:hypothetical protein
MAIDLVEQALEARTKQFVCEPHDPYDAKLLSRIQKGLIDSKQTPKGIKESCKKLRGLK